jgi:hypothetical protein
MTHALLQKSPVGTAEIKLMTDAYEVAMRRLGISDRLGPLSKLVAVRIVAIAKTGVRDPQVIAAQAIRTLGTPLGE